MYAYRYPLLHTYPAPAHSRTGARERESVAATGLQQAVRVQPFLTRPPRKGEPRVMHTKQFFKQKIVSKCQKLKTQGLPFLVPDFSFVLKSQQLCDPDGRSRNFASDL